MKNLQLLTLLALSGPVSAGTVLCLHEKALAAPDKCLPSDRRYELEPDEIPAWGKPRGIFYECQDGIWRSACTEAERDALAARPPKVDPAAPNDHRKLLLDRCEREWPGDFRMQSHCVEQQTEAASKIKGIADRVQALPDKRLMLVLSACVTEWEDGETYDYRMTVHCFERQEEAMRRMDAEQGR